MCGLIRKIIWLPAGSLGLRKTGKSCRGRVNLLVASVVIIIITTTHIFCKPYISDQLRVCLQKYAPNDHQLALVTSLWSDSNSHQEHRAEVVKSLSINVRNRHFSVVFVQLDGANGEGGCQQLVSDLERTFKVKSMHIRKLVCAYEGDVRLSYLRMFEIAKNTLLLQGYVVVLANGDMVFDDTIMKAKYVQKDTLLTIATRGHWRSPKRTPDRCYIAPKIRDSWDGYIFHPESLKLNQSLWLDEKTRRFFPMNQVWAEESALNAIHVASTSIEKFFQVCEEIHMWHLHEASKTYDEAAIDRVLHSATIAGECKHTCECLGLSSNKNRESLAVWDYRDLSWYSDASR